MLPPDDTLTSPVGRMLAGFLDPAWYLNRYPDLAGGSLDPYQHFVRFGATEARDPNPFFDTAWYVEHYPDVSASGLVPLLHYPRFGAAELRNPHPHFDAVYYVQQHPDAAVNPLLYHLRWAGRGYATEQAVDIADYLPSKAAPLPVPRGVFADVVIPVHRDADAASAASDRFWRTGLSRSPGSLSWTIARLTRRWWRGCANWPMRDRFISFATSGVWDLPRPPRPASTPRKRTTWCC